MQSNTRKVRNLHALKCMNLFNLNSYLLCVHNVWNGFSVDNIKECIPFSHTYYSYKFIDRKIHCHCYILTGVKIFV